MTNIICLLGSIPFGICGIHWNSSIMIIVSIIGVLFHSNPNNTFMYSLDLSMNIILSSFACYQNKNVIVPCLFALFIFVVNHYLYNLTKINKHLINLQHVIFVQGLGLYGYYLIYSQEKEVMRFPFYL